MRLETFSEAQITAMLAVHYQNGVRVRTAPTQTPPSPNASKQQLALGTLDWMASLV